MGRSDLLLEENCRKIGGKIQQKDTRRKWEEKKEIKSVNKIGQLGLSGQQLR